MRQVESKQKIGNVWSYAREFILRHEKIDYLSDVRFLVAYRRLIEVVLNECKFQLVDICIEVVLHQSQSCDWNPLQWLCINFVHRYEEYHVPRDKQIKRQINSLLLFVNAKKQTFSLLFI